MLFGNKLITEYILQPPVISACLCVYILPDSCFAIARSSNFSSDCKVGWPVTPWLRGML